MSTPVLLTPKEAAAFLKVAEKTLEGWRCKGSGPKFNRLGRRIVRYVQSDLDSWMACTPKATSTPAIEAQQ